MYLNWKEVILYSAIGLVLGSCIGRFAFGDTNYVTDVNSNNYQHLVVASHVPVVVEYSATWCPVCKEYKPVFEKVAVQYQKHVRFVSVDTDKEHELSKHIHYLPTTEIWVDGKPVTSRIGYIKKSELYTWIDKTLKTSKQTK